MARLACRKRFTCFKKWQVYVTTPPELNLIGNKTIDEASELSFSISASDPDGDTLTYSASVLPTGATFDSNTSEFSWTPTSSQSGTYNVTFTVTDSMGESDSETITITVSDKPPVFNAIEYFPLNVGDWQDYKINGSIERSRISGEKLIGGVTTKIRLYVDGQKEYYTSDQDGIKLYGQYLITEYYTGDIIFETPLLLMRNNATIGTSPVSTTTYSFTIYVPDSGSVTANVDLTSTTVVLGLEDVVTENSTLKDCIKVSTQFTQYIREAKVTITGDATYYWFYKGVGCVKQSSGSDTYIITESYVNGVNKTY